MIQTCKDVYGFCILLVFAHIQHNIVPIIMNSCSRLTILTSRMKSKQAIVSGTHMHIRKALLNNPSYCVRFVSVSPGERTRNGYLPSTQ